ncbi:multiprotein bridging factor aMBF1 [Methanobrevibacter curvatus]|jgi:putative transcription factor|uniref:Transcription factor n=1 Tax=Methanobrevibacter curvatus TaxID=49547 RepID=A0A166BCK4_9EURY|nr:multiprotein bridging factor aMBF1 [Methanobrevibacter curvatus]KZX13152.1 transcription factor [Methanobrevibacter curvatus]MDR3063175.1 multiprotein bridging factor aMBF1 [Methanobrevibacter sp.]
MRCEICGVAIEENPIRTKIDGSVMMVCEKCSKFGKIQKAPPVPKTFRKTDSKTKQQNPYKPRPMYSADEPTDDLVENFNDIIREKREKNKWSREELGAKINEKASVISRLESGKMIPDTKLATKIEKILKVKLLEEIGGFNLEEFKSQSNQGPTLGDIVKIKRK